MSSGGLVSALSGCKKTMKFTWIGWPGKEVSLALPLIYDMRGRCRSVSSPGIRGKKVTDVKGESDWQKRRLIMQIPEEDRELVNRRLMDEYDCYPVYLADDLADRHYNGMCISPSFPLSSR